jgi:glycosyltransferase involved in cell wall biosynthesis
MKKIAILVPYPKDATLEKLAGALKEQFELYCFVWDRSGDYEATVTGKRIHYITFDLQSRYFRAGTFFKLFLFQFWLVYKLLFTRVDCIHALNLSTGLPGYLAALLKRKPFVYHCLDPYYSILPESWPDIILRGVNRLENNIISRSDMFVITDMLRLPQHKEASPGKVIEFANIAQMDIPFEGKSFGQGTFRVGYIGSLTTGRNLETIAHAVGELKDEGIELLIGGHGPLASAIEALSGTYDNVQFTSWVPYSQVFEIEKDFDLFIQMSADTERRRWGSPNKLFESMFFSKPIIVGENTMGAKHVAVIGNGLIVPCEDKEKLKEAILHLKNDPSTSIEMGKRGRDAYDQNWNPAIMRKRIIEAYESILPSGQTVK